MALDVGAVGTEPLAAGDPRRRAARGSCRRRACSCGASDRRSARAPRARPSSTRRRARGARVRARAAARCRGRAKTVPGSRSSSQAVAIEPTSASNARGSLSECAARAKIASESTVMLRLDAGAVERGQQLVVVDDDPVVDADHRPVAHRVVVRGDRRMALRVVADVNEQLGGGAGDGDPLEQAARRRALLRHRRRRVAGPPVRVSDRVRAALRDSGQQRLRCQRAIDVAAPQKGCIRQFRT